MSGKHDQDRLIAYILNELPAEDRARVEAHLKECPRCRTRFEQLSQIGTRLNADAGTQTDPGNEEAFLVEVNQRIDAENERRPVFGLLRRLAVGGALVMLLLLLLRHPAPDAPRRPRAPVAQQRPDHKISRLAKHTPAVYPDFSGLLERGWPLAGKAPALSPSPMPAFPATPKLTEGVSLVFPKIKL